MKKKKYEYDDALPPRSHPDYMKIYRQRNKERLQSLAKEYNKNNPRPYDPESAAKWREDNREHVREQQWQRRGIIDLTHERFESDIKKQKGLCKICGEKMEKPQADHDHATGKYRAPLCIPCNNGLGVYEQKRHLFEEYLKEF